MNEELIKKIADEIINHGIFKNIYFYFFIILISVMSGTLTSLLSSYLKKRGENLATRADFEHFLQQLETSTRASESIKNKISSDFAEMSARKALIREKLEVFIETTFFIDHWLEKSRNELMMDEDKIIEFSASQISRLTLYRMIYFPKIEEELSQFSAAASAVWNWNSQTLYKVKNAKKNPSIDLKEIDIPAFERNELFKFRLTAQVLQNAIIEKYSVEAGFK